MQYLVATDGSEESDEAVQYAATQASAFDATLAIVHVLVPEAELVDEEMILPGGEQAADAGTRLLDQARRLATDAVPDGNLAVETQLLTGRPADAITAYAEEADVDAIYIGHRGLSAKREQVVGSVAKSVVDKATVPVTVIK